MVDEQDLDAINRKLTAKAKARQEVTGPAVMRIHKPVWTGACIGLGFFLVSIPIGVGLAILWLILGAVSQ